MKKSKGALESRNRGFTMLELLVAVAVTAILATMLLTITRQVVVTHGQTSGNLETNQIANFVLDRIQEDLHCALYRNDGGAWMAATISEDTSTSGSWKTASSSKPTDESIRLTPDDWADCPTDAYTEAKNQLHLQDCRFGVAGTWFRFFTQSPELDPDASVSSSVRAVSYQIVRHGLTGAPKSTPRYQLFRTDVSAKETFEAGYDLHPSKGKYLVGANERRQPGNIVNPIFTDESGKLATDFSLAANIIDFGIRAYLIEPSSSGSRYLQQIFPDVNATSGSGRYEYLASSNPAYRTNTTYPLAHAFPEVVDVMVRVLTTQGASAISSFEDGLVTAPDGVSDEEYWWQLAEENSQVYIRRVRILATGI
ncbi:MAG: prepilin-type N-terminal cleavage/methylation domain-containing protein [Opitutae bacterium]|nr:prepilin-type N-terminal cleavage/methylation domain-containing protein [Opitutae bacterium]MBT7740199.1 prepilin-type N-terminal cleavage/methylation domain-containing protein [Opitutae bacterium]